MENTHLASYQFEVLRQYGDSFPAALFATVAEAAAYCRVELSGHLNRTDDRAEAASVAAGQQVRFRGPQGLRWVKGLTHPVPAGTAPARFNPGQAVRLFGDEQPLTVAARDFVQGAWHYQFKDGSGPVAEALLFVVDNEPTPPAAAAVAAEPLLFSLHSSQILAGDEQGQPFWKPLPPRLFVQVQAGQPDQSRIVALCGTTGKRFLTHAYEHGPFQLADGQRLASVKALGDYFARQHRAMLPAEGAAMLLGVDGSIQEVRPVKGRTFKLAQLYAALECDYIDVHHPQHGAYQDWILVFDDEGKFKERPINPLATALWYETYPLDQYSPVDVVTGPVLLMRSEMMR